MFALIHGGGGSAWDWHLVAPALRERGHDVVAVDLPSEDESAGWEEYADAVVRAIGDPRGLVVVGHSLGGFTEPLVCARIRVDLLVLVAAMIPSPGELFADWWANAGYEESGYEDVFYHDVPSQLAAEARRRERNETSNALQEPWPLEAWPETPTRSTAATTSASAVRLTWLTGSPRTPPRLHEPAAVSRPGVVAPGPKRPTNGRSSENISRRAMSSRRVARPYGMKLTLTQFRWRGSGSILAACQTVDVGGVPYVRSSLPAGTLLIVERGFVILRVAPPRTNHWIITCDAGPRSARHARRSLGRWTSCGATASLP